MTGSSRRAVLLGLGLAGLAAACSDAAPASAPGPPAPPPSAPPTTTSSAPSPYVGEAASLAVCAALATLTADLLGQAATRAGQGRYGVVPAAVSTFLGVAGAQLGEHARAWNALLTADGLPAVDGAPLSVEPALRDRLEAARAPIDLVGLAADLAAVSTATTTATIGRVTDPAAAALAASVAPVTAMHGATASFLLGRAPSVPVDPAAGALGPDSLGP